MTQPSTDIRPPLCTRPILDVDGFQECVEFQRACYSSGLSVVPHHFLVHVTRSGGLVLGGFLRGFDEDETMVGFLLSLPMVLRQRPCLHTYSTLVKTGISIPYITVMTHLKEQERRLALGQGYKAITWYQDPFDLAYAELGLVTLLAKVTGMDRMPVGNASGFRVFGPIDLSQGKLILTWDLSDSQVQRSEASGAVPELDRSGTPTVRRHYEEVLIVASSETGSRYPVIQGLVRDRNLPRVAITIPAHIQEVCAKDSDTALRWRTAVLDAFDFYLGHGYSGTGERHEYGFRYLLTRIESACVIPD